MNTVNEIRNTPVGMSVKLDVYIFKEDGVVIAYSPALDLCGSGYTDSEARQSFHIAVTEYLDFGISHKTLVADLRAHGWRVRSLRQRKMASPSFDTLLRINDTFRDILENKDYRKESQPMPLPVIA
ncbi:MAG: hypothetical protein NC117_03930 [Pseudoflavonifractor sp.]|nr:hypothetical protein [Pseudoflavonifractor sp.]